MKLVPLNEIFEVTYGNKLDLNKMKIVPSGTEGSLHFVGRSAKNNGVTANVMPMDDIEPYAANLLTVALGGAILSTHLQVKRFYTAQNVAVLKPLLPLTKEQLLYYAVAIQHNEFRYGAFGREANRTLRVLEVPSFDSLPRWLADKTIPSMDDIKAPVATASGNINPSEWKDFKFSDLFEIKKGKRLTKQNMKSGETLFIGSSDSRNGVTARINSKPIHDGNTISVCYNGSVGEAFYQPEPYWATDDVNVLYPKFELNAKIALFLTTLIRLEKYRYNYGRKWHLGRMNNSTIALPVASGGEPDWNYMERVIDSRPFSRALS